MICDNCKKEVLIFGDRTFCECGELELSEDAKEYLSEMQMY